jgi:hypothetical protein
MAIEVRVPELGEGVESVEVVSVLVAEGDAVTEGQGLIEVETDKAAVEIPSTTEGTVSSVHVNPGQTLHRRPGRHTRRRERRGYGHSQPSDNGSRRRLGDADDPPAATGDVRRPT